MNKIHPEEQDAAVIAVQPGGDKDDDQSQADGLDQNQLQLSDTPIVSLLAGILCGPCTIIGSCFTVEEGEKKIILNTGKIVGQASEPGCEFFNCCFREVRSVSTKLKTLVLAKSKLTDKAGNPILVSAVVVFRVTEPLKALLQVTDLHGTLHTQALAVVRQVVARFPYESADNSPCLTHDAAVVNGELRKALQNTATGVGVTVCSFSLNELFYSGEVAANMLQRQSAQALVGARAFITKGVASITTLALNELEKHNVRLKAHQRIRLAGNMLALLSGVDSDGPVHHKESEE